MIAALRGLLGPVHPNPIVLYAGDVGYAVSFPVRFLSSHHEGDAVHVFIHTHVRDDAIELYGFETPEDLALFNLLLSVSGIGPKTSLAIVDRGSEPIRQAVQQSDVEFFEGIPRLGKKNAQKIIIELKNKLGSLTDLDLSGATPQNQELSDALESMGFGRKEINEALRNVPTDGKTLPERLRQALMVIGKTRS